MDGAMGPDLPDIGTAVRRLADQAALFDRSDADPAALLAPLIDADLFRQVTPKPAGLGWATDPGKTGELYELLRRIGAANASAGRLFEGHVNGVKLVFTFGNETQRARIGRRIGEGALMGVWNAEAPPGVRLEGPPGARMLRGSKIYASGVGLLDLPLITARDASGEVVMTTPAAARFAPHDLSGWRMRGMRATATGTLHLDGVPVEEDEILGAPGDYYRRPGFRGGAWRFAAVQLGALEDIARLALEGLGRRGRADDPHQKARAGQIEMAVETARLVSRAAADAVETNDGDPARAEAYAGMARLVVERSALEVIALTERGLGLMAFAEAERLERVVRDLTTYLRQPFPDAVLEGVGEWALTR